MKYLLINDGCFRNKGNEAITKSIIANLKSNSSDQFTILSTDLPYDNYVYQGAEVVRCPSPHKYLKRFSKSWKQMVQCFESCDVVISVASDAFCETYGLEPFLRELSFISMATKKNKPVFMLGGSFVPLRLGIFVAPFVNAVKKIQLITARDLFSFNNLYKIVNTPHGYRPRCDCTADPAFLLEPAGDENKLGIFNLYRLPADRCMVALIPSQGISKYVSGVGYKTHLAILINLVKHLVFSGYHVLLIPHVVDSSPDSDDRTICEKIYRGVKDWEHVTYIHLKHSAEELKAIIGLCEFAVGERMHGAIAALSQNIPALSIGYGEKYGGVLGDIFGYDEVGKHLIKVENLEEQKLIEQVDWSLAELNGTKSKLQATIPLIKDRAKRNFTLVKEALEK